MSMDQEWTTKFANAITSTHNTITMHIPCAHGMLTIHHELDQQQRFHTHIAMQNIKDNGEPGAYIHIGFYRPPDGNVIGPIFRD
jgi:hypothetical protein